MKLLNNNIYKYVYKTVENIYIYILNKQSPEKKSLKLLAYPRNNITGFTFLTPLRKLSPKFSHTRLQKDKDNGSP